MTTNLLTRVRAYLDQYMVWASPDQSLAASLWVLGTYMWDHFDCFPYMAITANTKQAGKSRCMELLSFVARNSDRITGATPASVYTSIRDNMPTLFIDEAEKLSSESSELRPVLNGGYRRGMTVKRMGKGGIVEWPLYCAKCFVLIGDVFDTLRDRSIIIKLRRGSPSRRFIWTDAESEGAEIGRAIKAYMDDMGGTIMEAFTRLPSLDWLRDRDEEIWSPLFAICQVVAPESFVELQRVAADMAAEKSAPARAVKDLAAEEEKLDALQYGEQLVRDLLRVMGDSKMIYSADALTALHAIPTAPWRRFRGVGLSAIDMANLLNVHEVKPKLIRTNGKRANAKVARGYRREDVEAALARLG